MQRTASLVHLVRQPLEETAGDVRPPLLILLHGVGANELQMSSLAPRFDPRCIVVSVRSPIAMAPSSFGWFHVRFSSDGPIIVEREAVEAWKSVASFAREAIDLYGADADRIFVGGFSQGGIVALASLLTAPAIFAGAFSLSGRLLPEVLPHVDARGVEGKPALIVHGIDDDKLPVHLARWAQTQLQRLGLAVSYREFPMGHEITAASLSEVTCWLTTLIDTV